MSRTPTKRPEINEDDKQTRLAVVLSYSCRLDCGSQCRQWDRRLPGISWNGLCTNDEDERDATRERCRGMYSKSAMGGSVNPYITVIFSPIKGDEAQIVSLIIFSWDDVLDVGVPSADGSLVCIRKSSGC